MRQHVRRRRVVSPAAKPSETRLHEHSKRQSRRYQHCTSLAVVCIVVVTLVLARILLFGIGTWEGGIIGKYVDESARKCFLERRNKSTVQLPNVVQRSNRAVIPGHSRYLEEILERFQPESKADFTGREQVSSEYFAVVSVKVERESVGQEQESHNKRTTCNLGWFCQRCLSSPQLGTVTLCSPKCPKCLSETYCQDRGDLSRSVISVKRTYARVEARIPRIVHQMWFEPLDAFKNPELARIQNAWRASEGYKYQFYTVESARAYIIENYPTNILAVFDSITPQRARFQFFQLLVLFKDGGVFADIDMVLETNLKNLIPGGISFVGVRSDGLLDHCLSMGFLASEPGNEFIGTAIELATSSVLNLDQCDVEARVCRGNHHDAPLWKLRMIPGKDNLIGGCALGMAVNAGLGLNELQDFRPGFHADTLILAMSKNDAGAARVSDVDRNILVASTELLGLSKFEVRGRAKLLRNFWI